MRKGRFVMPAASRLRIVIPGGSGQVGRILARHFHSKGHAVVVVSRQPATEPWKTIQWNGTTLGDWSREIDGADVVINLAGRSVNCRYNAVNKHEITASRVNATRVVGEAIAAAARPPALWMNASTATIYRHTFDRAMDESGELGGAEPDVPPTWRFSIDVARAWERAFFDAPVPHTRKIALRSAMTMSPDAGGIFDTLLGLVRARLGGKSGSGRQFVSWIHHTDFERALDFLIAREDLDGVVNVSAPNPLSNRDFMRALRQAWGTRIGLPAAAWMLEFGAIFLRTETELILKSRRVLPKRLLDAGFEFQFPEWRAAAEDLVREWREVRLPRRAPLAFHSRKTA
jgi:uncharacterized protein (TIGR01777 family)